MVMKDLDQDLDPDSEFTKKDWARIRIPRIRNTNKI